MPIKVIEEEPEMIEIFQVYEECVFCRKTTKFWHETSNTPVCPDCAATHTETDVEKAK